MIVPTMSEKELKSEIVKDQFNAFRFSDHYDKKFRRIVLNARKFPVRTILSYKSPRKNRWFIFYEARSKKEVGDNARVTFVVTFESPYGLHAVLSSFTNGVNHLVIYPPHFWRRFRSRCNLVVHGEELIRKFFINNSSYVYSIKDTYIDETSFVRECYGSTADGVALGLISQEGNILFKTFITYDMLRGEQIHTFTENERIRQEIHSKQ